jgi:hypothetical protein
LWTEIRREQVTTATGPACSGLSPASAMV